MSAYWNTAPAVLAIHQGRALPTQTDAMSELRLLHVRHITLNVTGIDMFVSTNLAALRQYDRDWN
jgi:hypothetical protein